MYSIAFRHDLNLLDVAWTGLMTEAVAHAYVEELTARFVREGFRSGYRLRMDFSRVAVQPQEAVMTINSRCRGFPRASRIAIVTTSGITRLQVRRLMPQPYLSIFDTADAALAWLVQGNAIAA
ncbi:hypothetical protein QE361_000464 [Sphingomonas sp. SORGH_AS802]|jgi:hypothetical protein|uniref:STAS/SEC14 domain-containing protein n=1 Tax=unclassified Sphingomonas TaxID=196159 RepID=UPI00285F786D|nr:MULTISPECIES: STAS/SEC14 domain-containing protein [unclassified Sphingomonas]MDR6127582.1 hypothetical protein [Sphingomonas sp. SORGH_AS_0438]MDR6133506.1 hypothetical protein [Sphingomonas sp. SORGH_AS_0802]